ncbi:uncharacterized protein LOC116328508 isoform X2 [Oreochromis aureus]|uniref:uncharacterized protein LOC116328508 isoform X2 n=1 Tax=Oreochromis aureus TaxID=47969 RepID=UPI0019532620|nr:uncharacterized protein LOC116328508 isoform X2 [Oreochromis aureus]
MAMHTDDIGRDMQGKKIYPVTEYSKSQRIALLINIINFDNPESNRDGAEKDTQAMLNLFHYLGYEVVDYQDLTAQEIDEALINFSKHPKLFNTDSVFVVLMSHGDLGTICGSDLKDFETDKIYERLNTKNCPALMNKPKVIIIQACRGGNDGVVKVSGSRQVMATEYIKSSSKNVSKGDIVHVEKDFIGFYSSTRYTFSYRNPKYGSRFIHYICDVISTYCHMDDIEELFKKVMRRFEDSPEHKQMPTKERVTLTKDFYLLPGIKHLSPGEQHRCVREESLRNQADLQYVKNFQLQNDKVRHVRVLLYGPVGAGKSSFINSVSNVLRRRITCPALTNATNEGSFTKKYETHKIKKDGGQFYPFVFNDLMGLEEGSGRGVRVEDIKLAMMGHVKEGYKFNTWSPLSMSDCYYNPSPSPEDRVHVVVCVHSGNTTEINSSVLQKMKAIREAASDLGIPQLAVLTKFDEACPETDKDLKNVYKSKLVKRKMGDLSSKLGIPLNFILPVKNYSEEIQLNDDIDTLILRALRMMIDFTFSKFYFVAPPAPPRPPTPPRFPIGLLVALSLGVRSLCGLKTPWRQISWGNQADLQYVKNFQLQNDQVRHVRVLLYGPVGAGKSSFINSVSSVLRRRITCPALTNATNEGSFTKKYTAHKIKKDAGQFYPFVFNDLMGLEEGSGRGVRVEDIKLAMIGHVKEGYKFNPWSPLSTSDCYYNPSPSPEDRVHVVVCVYSGNTTEINSSVLQKMKAIRETASDLGIPQLAVLTKFDEACPETEEDLKNTYKSKLVKRKVNFSWNYREEIQLNDDVDTLILSALRMTIDLGEDFIDSKL